MATFIQAAKSFKYADGSDVYVGPVIVSEDCIYLTCKKVIGVGNTLQRNLGAAGAVLSTLVKKEADPLAYAVPIPESVCKDPHWPAPPELPSAIIIRKADAEKIAYPFWGSLRVTVNGVEFTIMADFFSRNKILRLFAENHWPM
ncbi:MAG: hypothetical protein QNJ22_09745 [Desulfosarcinaceae bacterium]|nr:hypothetical protein [Desulfosarcinaceae bacterium]